MKEEEDRKEKMVETVERTLYCTIIHMHKPQTMTIQTIDVNKNERYVY